MRTLALFSFALTFFFGACLSPKSDSKSPLTVDGEPDFTAYDTLAKANTDSLLNQIHQEINEAGPPRKIPYTVYDPTDTIYFWTLENETARISLELNVPDGINWPVFYLHRGNLIYIRYRYYLDAPEDSSARESKIYFDNNHIVYCEERSIQLESGGIPGSLRAMDFAVSTRSVEEIEADYKDIWQIVLQEMDKYKDLPGYMEKFKQE